MSATWVRYNNTNKYWEYSTDAITFTPLLEHLMGGNIGIGNTAPDKGEHTNAAGTVLTLDAASLPSYVELSNSAADAAGTVLGGLDYIAPNNSSTKRIVAEIKGETEGATASNRGGRIKFLTKPNGSTALVEAMRIRQDGFVGIGGNDPTGTLDLNGHLVIQKGSVTLVNGDNNDVNIAALGSFSVTGPSAAFAVTGMNGGIVGRTLTVIYTGVQQFTLKNNNAGSIAANRILTLTGADQKVVAATFMYDGSNWILVSFH